MQDLKHQKAWHQGSLVDQGEHWKVDSQHPEVWVPMEGPSEKAFWFSHYAICSWLHNCRSLEICSYKIYFLWLTIKLNIVVSLNGC